MSPLLLSEASPWERGMRCPEVLLVTRDKMAHLGLRTLMHTLPGGGARCQVVDTPADALAACTPDTSLVVWMVSRYGVLTGSLETLAAARCRYATPWLVMTDVLAGVFAWLGRVCGGVTVLQANLSRSQLARVLHCLLHNIAVPQDIVQATPARPLTRRLRQALLQILRPGKPVQEALQGLSSKTLYGHRWRISAFLQIESHHALTRYPGLVPELLGMIPPGGGMAPSPVACIVTDVPFVASAVRHLLQEAPSLPVVLTLKEAPRYLPPGCHRVIWLRAGAYPAQEDLQAMHFLQNITPGLHQVVLTLKDQASVCLPGVENVPLSSPLCRLIRLLAPDVTPAGREVVP